MILAPPHQNSSRQRGEKVQDPNLTIHQLVGKGPSQDSQSNLQF